MSFWKLVTRITVLVLGMTPLLHAQTTADNGPVFCPPLNQFLTPTLLDVFLYPGFTFR